MVSVGGADADNATSRVLDALAAQKGLPDGLHITVVMGSSAPHLDTVRDRARTMPVSTDVRVNVTNMAALMCEADLAIGAAGSTSWERCCLGLPTMMLVLADNQASSAAALGTVKGAVVLGGLDTAQDIAQFTQQITYCADPKRLHQMAQNAATVLDGHGTHRVYETLTKEARQ